MQIFDIGQNSTMKYDITSISSAIQKIIGLKPTYTPHPKILKAWGSRTYKNIALIIIDGMGAEQLRYIKGEYLTQNIEDIIDTVTPASTVAATTTFITGLLPIKHGLFGWSQYYKESDEIIENYANRNFYTQKASGLKNAPLEMMPESIVSQANKVDGWRACEIMPEFRTPEHKDIENWARSIKTILNNTDNYKYYVYAYWSEFDSICHSCTDKSPVAINHLEKIQSIIKKLRSVCPNTLFVVTADHGHIDCSPIFIENMPNIIKTQKMPVSCESRCAQFFIKPEFKNEFPKIFFENFSSDDFELIDKEKFKKEYLMWQDSAILSDSAIGGYIAYGISDKTIWQNSKQFEFCMAPISEHGGGTDKEMQVPLIILQ